MFPIDNRIAVLIVSALMSWAVNTTFINAQAFFLSFLNPVYTLYISVVSGILFSLFLRSARKQRKKFANFALLIFAFYILSLLFLVFGIHSPSIQAFILFFLAVFGIGLFRWLNVELSLHHLDPARAQSHFPYIAASEEIGTLVAALSIKIYGMNLNPKVLIGISAFLFFITLIFVAAQFLPKKNLEIHFTKKIVPSALLPRRSFAGLLIIFSLLAVSLGTARTGEDYLIKVVLKQQIGSYEGIREMMANYLLITSIVIIIINLTLGRIIKRKHISPILLLRGHTAVLIPFVVACLFLPSLYLFIALEMIRRITENCFYSPSNQMIISSFIGEFRSKLQSNIGLFYFTIPRVLLAIIFSGTFLWMMWKQTQILLVLLLSSLLVSFLLTNKYKKQLVSVLYSLVSSGHKAASIMALEALSFLRPSDYEQQMVTLLTLSPKKILRKTIILGLGYVEKDSSITAITKEFDSEKEEIQISVLDALRLSQNYNAIRFIYNVIMAREKPKSLRVRLNASAILMGIYGRKAIPFLLNGLDDSDPRVIANTLETLGNYHDRTLIPYFKRFVHHSSSRVRANSLMGLSFFREMEAHYTESVQKILKEDNLPMIASILYVIGKIQDMRFQKELHRIAHSPLSKEPVIQSCLGWALTQIRHPEGFKIFGQLFTEPYHEGHPSPFLHFYGQLKKETRFDLIKDMIVRYGHNPMLTKIIKSRLRHSHFDFHDEIEYLELMIASQSEATEIASLTHL